MYQRQCAVTETPVSLVFTKDSEDSEESEQLQAEGIQMINRDEEPQFDESSDEEEPCPDDETAPMLIQGEIGTAATFLLGARTRFGRVVRFNNRLLY